MKTSTQNFETAIKLNGYVFKKIEGLRMNLGLLNTQDDAFAFVYSNLTRREFAYYKKQIFAVINSNDERAFAELNKVNNLVAHALINYNK